MGERRLRRLKPKKVKGRIQVLKAMPYKDCMVYIRRIEKVIFEYLLVFNKLIYSSYMIITPRKGKTDLNKDEISQCTELLWAGAEATIDTLLGTKLSEEDKKKVEAFKEVEKVLN